MLKGTTRGRDLIWCLLTNSDDMKVPPAPESIMAVVATVFFLFEERIEMGTRSSFLDPTDFDTSTDLGSTDVASVFLIKNPSGRQ
jgi:hypothetical protein